MLVMKREQTKKRVLREVAARKADSSKEARVGARVERRKTGVTRGEVRSLVVADQRE